MEPKAPLHQQQGAPLTKSGMPVRRLVPPPPPPGSVPMMAAGPGPTPTGLAAPANTTATAGPLSPGQVIALVRDARKKALGDEDAAGDVDAIKPGITLDLIAKGIPALPDEVVDILRNGVERLALSHNALSSLPLRFSMCTSLRYFAARNNAFETFPLPLCHLASLEFLDLGRNGLKELPAEISQLTSLKALAVVDNQIERLPLAVASMAALQRLRLAGNPIKFPPNEVLQVRPEDVPANEVLSKSEVVELIATDQIKKFLSQCQSAHATTDAACETEGADEESSEGADTPRITTRRATGRFPIKVKGSDAAPSPPVSRSPSLSRPPIPGRSHFRGLSQFSNAPGRKPGIIPLTMGKSSESLRSNGEPHSSQDEQRPESRSSRQGGPANGSEARPQKLLAVNEPKMNRFSSHLRGFSYSGTLTLTNPFSPEDPSLLRPLYVRELPALPVRQYESRAVDPVLEVARGILYSIFQTHVGVQTLMSLTNDGSSRRSSLEMIFYNTNVYFVELEQAIQDYDLASGARGVAREHGAMQRAYTTLIQAYVHICSRLIKSVDLLVDNGDQRYMRTFLMLVYHSIMELRVAISGWVASKKPAGGGPAPEEADPIPIPPKSRSRATSAVREPSRTTPELSNSSKKPRAPPVKPVRTDLPYPPTASGRAVTAIAVTGAHRPDSSSSGDSFTSAISSVPSDRGRPNPTSSSSPPPSRNAPISAIKAPHTADSSETHFERFYLSLKTSTDLVQRLIPSLNSLLTAGLRRARISPNSPQQPNLEKHWGLLLSKSETVLKANNLVREKLSTLRLRDPNLTRYSPFWDLCRDLFSAWSELGDQIRIALVERVMPLPPENIVEGLKRISRSTKESIDLMVVTRRASGGGSGGSAVGRGGASRSGSRARWAEPVGPLPMTPQSAALGPAARATRGFSGEP